MSVDGNYSNRSLSPPPLIEKKPPSDVACQADLTPHTHEITIEELTFELPLYCIDPWTESYVSDPVFVACGCIFDRATFTDFPDDEITCTAHLIEVDKTFIFNPDELPDRIKEIYSIVLEKLGHEVERSDSKAECEVIENNDKPQEIPLTTIPTTYIDPISKKFIDQAVLATCGCIFNRATIARQLETICPTHRVAIDHTQLIEQDELTKKIRHFVLQVRSAMHTLPPLQVTVPHADPTLPQRSRLGLPPLLSIEPKLPNSPVRNPGQNSHIVTPKGRRLRRIYPAQN